MKSKEEIKQWLLENATDEDGKVVLEGIEFDTDLIIKDCKVSDMYVNRNKVSNMYVNRNEVSNYMDVNSNKVSDMYVNRNKVSNMDVYSNEVSNYMCVDRNKVSNMDVYSNEVSNNMYVDSNEVTNEYYPEYAIEKGVRYDVDYTDGYYLMIDKKSERNGLTIIEGHNRMGHKVYLYKNSFVAYHSYRSKQDAKEGFKRKLEGFEANLELLDNIKDKGFITREDYHQLTGACLPGIQAFADRLGRPNDNKLSLKDLKELLKPNDYGYEYIKKWGLLEENDER